MVKRSLALLACLATLTFATGDGLAANAKEDAITISTVAQPSADAGIDRAALREAMEEAIKTIDPKSVKRPVSIALSVIATSNDPSATCQISLAIADRKKGTILGTAAGSAIAAPNAAGESCASLPAWRAAKATASRSASARSAASAALSRPG